MTNSDFWEQINSIIFEGFTPEGLAKLDEYADKFTCGHILYKRFSPTEQHGCSAGGYANVIASILSGADVNADPIIEGLSDFKRQCQRAEAQTHSIEAWARAVGCWVDNVDVTLTKVLGEQLAEGGETHVYKNGVSLTKIIGLDYFIEPILALDRISLHNAYFPETTLKVVGFGRNGDGDFFIIAEQAFIQGYRMTDDEIATFLNRMGFSLINPRNWTWATPEVYLSDMHDENLIRSKQGNIFVVDCDIRINTPELRCGGTRVLTTEVEIR